MKKEEKKDFKELLANEVRPFLVAVAEAVKKNDETLNKILQRGQLVGEMHKSSDGSQTFIITGERGSTPQVGKDFYTEAEKESFLKAATPVFGKHYCTPAQIKEMIKAATPVKGVHYKDGAPGKDAVITDALIDEMVRRAKPIKGIHYKDGEDGAPGAPGADGTEITAEQIRDKLESLKGKFRVKIDAIAGLREALDGLVDAIAQASIPSGIGGSGDTTINNTTTGATGATLTSIVLTTQLSQVGNDVVIDLTSLPHTLVSVFGLTRNNQRQTPGASFDYLVTGTTSAIVYGAVVSDVFLLDYFY